MSLAEKENLISDLETQNEMLRSGTGVAADDDGKKRQNEELVAACESDKVAASRAMAQNEQLKEQLQELQMAVIKLVYTRTTTITQDCDHPFHAIFLFRRTTRRRPSRTWTPCAGGSAPPSPATARAGVSWDPSAGRCRRSGRQSRSWIAPWSS